MKTFVIITPDDRDIIKRILDEKCPEFKKWKVDDVKLTMTQQTGIRGLRVEMSRADIPKAGFRNGDERPTAGGIKGNKQRRKCKNCGELFEKFPLGRGISHYCKKCLKIKMPGRPSKSKEETTDDIPEGFDADEENEWSED